MAIEIREHTPGANLDSFLQAGHDIFRGDPNWVAPLDMEIRDRLTPGKNPFFLHAEATLFTAWKDGRLAGRCSAQIDREHLKVHNDDVGFFGFFDTVDDPEVAKALLNRAEAWLRMRGMKKIRGPFSLSINEECGTLVEGFDTPPYVSMAHSRPYQGGLIEQAGLSKIKDLLAWQYDATLKLNTRTEKAWTEVKAMPEVKFRSVNKKNLRKELGVIMDIFNDAWSNNWGFVPLTSEELSKAAEDMKLIIDEDLAFTVEIEGRPVAMCVCLPNLNEAIADLEGKLFPTGLIKLLWRTKVKRPASARLMLLGIRRELRTAKKYGGLSMAMYAEVHKRGLAKGYTKGELSWTLEDNAPVNLGIKAMGGRVYKKYRIYEKEL